MTKYTTEQLAAFSFEELRQERRKVVASCAGWARCCDGSHEIALREAGLDDINEEYNRRGILLYAENC